MPSAPLRTLLAAVAAAAVLITTACTPVDSGTGGGTFGGALAGGYGWNRTQTDNARLIVQVGREMGVPRYGQQIALATAMQESKLTNLSGGPDDSAGLFQQRPSQGWGTYRQVTTPRYAAHKFYAALLEVPEWQVRPVYDAAQAVQRSCCPLLYQQWAPEARRLRDAVTG